MFSGSLKKSVRCIQSWLVGPLRERLLDAFASERADGLDFRFARRLVEQELPALERKLEAAGVPWTPGRGVPGG